MQRIQKKSAAQLAEEWSLTQTEEQTSSQNQEIYELGLSEPALCCCEYSESTASTGGNHISHHFCECKQTEDALVKLFSSCCTDSNAWYICLQTIQYKSLIPFPGGAIKVPLEIWFGLIGYVTFHLTGWFVYFENNPLHSGAATILLMGCMLWFNLMTIRRRYRTDVFLTWFLISVLHDAYMLWSQVFYFGTIFPVDGTLLLSLGFIMLIVLRTIRKQANQAHVKYLRSETTNSAEKISTIPLRSKHCSLCDHQMDTFDHHCTFINCCVSSTNHVAFILFLMITTINIAWFIFLFKYWFYPNIYYTGTLVYNLMILPFIAGLTVFQSYLISINMTTNEWILRNKYEHLKNGKRPFNQGICLNISKFLSNDRSVTTRRTMGFDNTKVQNGIDVGMSVYDMT